MPESFKASAPGKLMLLGEHAVLHGRLSLVCAVSQRIHVTLRPRMDAQVRIYSERGEYATTLADLHVGPPYAFVLSAIRQQLASIQAGLDLVVQSDFTDQVGLGSSAAVTAATTAVLLAWLGLSAEPQTIFDASLRAIQEVQGTGSGADLAASVFGGVLAYRMQPLEITPLAGKFPLTVVNSGYKEPTVRVIRMVEEQRQRWPEIYGAIFDTMGMISVQAIAALQHQDWPILGALFNLNQGLMAAIGVSNLKLAEIVYRLRADAGIFGAKISGSGLGDCIIGVGTLTDSQLPFPVLPLEISETGVCID